FASNRLGIEFDPADFTRSDFAEAERTAREKASRMIPTQIQEAIDENLSSDVEEREWNWQAMAHQVNTRWGLKLNDRELKKIGRENLPQNLTEFAEQAVNAVDLSAGAPYLESDWRLRSVAHWAKNKFQVKVELADLAEK